LQGVAASPLSSFLRVDWTNVATAAIAASAGIGGGYFSGRWQAKVGFRQVDAEMTRLQATHAEEHLRNRQSTYHEFLDQAGTWERMAATTRHIFGEEEPSEDAQAQGEEADRRFRHLLNGVLLFGTEPVRSAAKRLEDIHTQITADWWARIETERARASGAADRPRPKPVGFAFPIERRPEWEQALEQLIDMMRADVAPESPMSRSSET
jgi:hypothetical protein